jgi:hypothetical protein
MKVIQPVTVWYNGQEVQATILNASVSSDNLLNSATFAYQLFEEVGDMPLVGVVAVSSNYLTMTGEDYLNWNDNDYAYNWIAGKLNLTITGEYVPPVPVPPTPVLEKTKK